MESSLSNKNIGFLFKYVLNQILKIIQACFIYDTERKDQQEEIVYWGGSKDLNNLRLILFNQRIALGYALKYTPVEIRCDNYLSIMGKFQVSHLQFCYFEVFDNLYVQI